MESEKKILRPVERAEFYLINNILEGLYPPGSRLPGERMLADIVGVTRSTLREALRRIERDGWVKIQQGKQTLVNNYWKTGEMNILSSMIRVEIDLPIGIIDDLLEVRTAIAPLYAKLAIRNNALYVGEYMKKKTNFDDDPVTYANFDWNLHKRMAILSKNQIFPLILNGFDDLYTKMAERYFSHDFARKASKDFYEELELAAKKYDEELAEKVTEEAMQISQRLWRKITEGSDP